MLWSGKCGGLHQNVAINSPSWMEGGIVEVWVKRHETLEK